MIIVIFWNYLEVYVMVDKIILIVNVSGIVELKDGGKDLEVNCL